MRRLAPIALLLAILVPDVLVAQGFGGSGGPGGTGQRRGAAGRGSSRNPFNRPKTTQRRQVPPSRRPTNPGQRRFGPGGSSNRVPQVKVPKIKIPEIKVPTFKTVKKCSNCFKEVSESARAGQRCPHCGTKWTYDTSGTTSNRSRTSRAPSRSSRSSSSSRSSFGSGRSSSSFGSSSGPDVQELKNGIRKSVNEEMAKQGYALNTNFFLRSWASRIICMVIFVGAAITGLVLRFN